MLKKIFFICLCIVLSICPGIGQKLATVSPTTFKNLVGKWEGTLNYSGTVIRKPYTTHADLAIRQIGKTNKFTFLHSYTNDPGDISNDTIIISKDGRKLNGQIIKSKRTTRAGNLEIITEAAGFDHDNNKPAIIRQTYTFGKQLYTYKKQVQLQGQAGWLDRQEFKYARKGLRK